MFILVLFGMFDGCDVVVVGYGYGFFVEEDCCFGCIV